MFLKTNVDKIIFINKSLIRISLVLLERGIKKSVTKSMMTDFNIAFQ